MLTTLRNGYKLADAPGRRSVRGRAKRTSLTSQETAGVELGATDQVMAAPQVDSSRGHCYYLSDDRPLGRDPSGWTRRRQGGAEACWTRHATHNVRTR